jgi:hypothetical protein
MGNDQQTRVEGLLLQENCLIAWNEELGRKKQDKIVVPACQTHIGIRSVSGKKIKKESVQRVGMPV